MEFDEQEKDLIRRALAWYGQYVVPDNQIAPIYKVYCKTYSK